MTLALRRPANRADHVRSRRAKDIKQRVVIATDTVRTPGRYTPIVTRNEPDTVPILQQARRKTRRKFYLPLTGGAEIRLPAIPILKPGWRLVSALILVICALGVYAMWTLPYFRISNVKLMGANRVTLDEIQSLAPMYGQRMLTILPGQIARVIQNAYPVLSEVKVSMGFPGVIYVRVQERVPVLQWNQGGSTQWISADGIAFEPKGEAEELVTINAEGAPPTGKVNLTLVRQENRKSLASLILKPEDLVDPLAEPINPPRAFMDPQMIPAIQAIAKQIPEGVQLEYHPTYGLGWTDPQGWNVYFGLNPDDMPAKLNMYREIINQLKAKGTKPTLISMENLYAPYYRTE
jgi:cell division protein FtsQ